MPLLLCQREPYLQQNEAKVLSCTPTPAVPCSGKKKKKKKSKREQSAKTFDVKLSDSVCFATGGGQPHDIGSIGDSSVVNVYRDPSGDIIHQTTSALTVGDEHMVKINWSRRYDHMQQHTGQHLVSAVFLKRGHETLSWSLTARPGACFVILSESKSLSEEVLAEVEAEINAIIRQGTAHTLHIIESLEDAKAHPYFDANPQKLTHVEGGAVRMMHIDGLGYNMCCGTHLKNLGELQMIKLTSLGADGKVEFLAGGRCQAALARSLKTDVELKQLLSVPPSLFSSTVARKLAEGKTAMKEVTNLQKELALILGRQMYASCLANANKMVHMHRPGASLDFLKTIASAYKTCWTDGKVDGSLLLTASNTVARDIESKEGVFLIVGPAVAFGRTFCGAVGGSGGGRGVFQGKAKDISTTCREEGMRALLKALLV